MITGIKDVYYNVSDMDKAIQFYTQILGLKVASKNDYWTSLTLSGIEVGLHWTEGEPVPEIPYDNHGVHCGATLTLSSDNIDKDKQSLIDNQVEIIGESNEDWGKIVVFKDMDGNILKLMQKP